MGTASIHAGFGRPHLLEKSGTLGDTLPDPVMKGKAQRLVLQYRIFPLPRRPDPFSCGRSLTQSSWFPPSGPCKFVGGISQMISVNRGDRRWAEQAASADALSAFRGLANASSVRVPIKQDYVLLRRTEIASPGRRSTVSAKTISSSVVSTALVASISRSIFAAPSAAPF